MRVRRNFTTEETTNIFMRWRRGECVSFIAEALKRRAVTVWQRLAATGGFSPAPRVRREGSLTVEEREEISRGLGRNESLRGIATRLGRSASTICREVRRNGGLRTYRASAAEQLARARARRPKRCKLAEQSALRREVARLLEADWSPVQISNWLRVTYRTPNMHISPETIYKSLFVQARGVLKKELTTHLRTRRLMRTPKRLSKSRSSIPDAVSISERPASVEDRAVPGHWEGDLLQGANHSYIATLVERSTRYVMLVKVASKETAVVVKALKTHIRKLPAQLRKSLTWDRGREMAAHKEFTLGTDVAVYFCDPASPWQRGSNENTNGLLRQYFSVKDDLRGVSQARLNAVARRLNTRPRQTLSFRTPAAMLSKLLR